MLIEIRCGCGKKMKANHEVAGRSIQCNYCGRKVTVPIPAALNPEPAEETAPVDGTAPVGSPMRDSLYWLFILFLFPLALDLGQPEATLKQRILDGTPPELRTRVAQMIDSGDADVDDILAILPHQRLTTALLPRHSHYPWIFALASAVVFWCLILSCFAEGSTEPRYLIYVGFITGTLGICLVLLSHFIPFIAIADARIFDPHSDFMRLFAGFTFGAGLVEELGKLVPLLWYYYRYRSITWRQACLWGLASGAGFGIAEGIDYSDKMYNGLMGGDAYWVRFASCVALHAIWTASAGMTFYSNPELFQELFRIQRQDPMFKGLHEMARDEKGEILTIKLALLAFALLRVVIIVMFLHGLYDTALSRSQNALALATAMVSFGWFAWQIESFRRAETPPESLPAV